MKNQNLFQQLMDSGLPGQSGQHVQKAVGVEQCQEKGLAFLPAVEENRV